jgi:hypothetical protein
MGGNDKHKHTDNELAGGRTGATLLTSSRTAGDVVTIIRVAKCAKKEIRYVHHGQ